MNKKKLLMPLSIALAFLTIVLTSCGGNDSGDNNKDTTTSVDTTTETSTSVDTTTSADTTTTSTSINTTTNPGTTTSSDINTTTSADVTTTTAGDVTTTSETNTSTSTDTTTSTDTSTSTSTETSTDPTTTTDIGPQYETFNVTYFNKNNEEIDDIGSNPTTISENDGIVVLNSLSRVGHTFDGFFTDKACSNKITQIDSSSLLEDVVLYVSFTAIRYNVTFNINATYGTNPNTFSTYSIESDTITLLDSTAKT